MHRIINSITLVICCLFFNSTFGQQTPYLEKTVTIRNSTLSYAELFKQLSAQTGVVFSYTNFDDSRKVSVSFYKKPLRVVLNTVLNEGSCTYKAKGKYIILSCKTPPKKTEQPPSDVVVNGYIYNAVDSTHVPQTSVYISQYRQSVITNEYGYFTMSVPRTSDVLSVSIAKENYEDTTVVILSRPRNTLVVYLEPKAPPVKITVDDTLVINYQPIQVDTISTDTMTVEHVPFWQRLRDKQINLRNINDTFFTKYSFSFVPPISTNHLLSVNTVNDYSFNILAGISQGVNVMEIGGILNIDYGDVGKIQLAGITNIVSGKVSGVQLAGILNAVEGDVNGVQAAGIINGVGGNVSKVQLAGISNLVLKNVNGIQLAGISNGAKRVNGFQLAGIVNLVDTIKGHQLAGIVNLARRVEGGQIAGIINAASVVHGYQLGFINVADTVKGVPVGFLSFVRSGYHQLEVATDENLINTLSFRTGVSAFHNQLFGGLQFGGGNPLWTLGYGVGSAIRLGNRWNLDIELTGQQLDIVNDGDLGSNQLVKFYLGAEWRIGKKIGLAAGPSINWLNQYTASGETAGIAEKLNVEPFYLHEGNDFTNRLWFGGRVALRFF